jgi:hypothetical protein
MPAKLINKISVLWWYRLQEHEVPKVEQLSRRQPLNFLMAV